jgi:hypothetical protein
MAKKHFIGMAGLHGCLPQTCDVYATKGDAAQSLGDIHELSKNKIRLLRRAMYLELDLSKHGNEYCEIAECECDDPAVHSDSGEWNDD